ncbi:MAG TPA: hypothetical protein VG457_17805, partial [Planctomycetota bacterium]|nr:hypothetical protein [Planctomycetota bacterium]
MLLGVDLASLLLLLISFPAPQQDLDEFLNQADKLFEQAKEGYESGKLKASAEGLTSAAFKLEEARVKYLVIQELARDEKQQTAVNRLKEVQKL